MSAMARGCALVVIVLVDGVALFRGEEIAASRIDLSYEPTAAAVSPDDTIVCISGSNKVIHVYSVSDNNTLTEINSISHHVREIHSLSFSSDGSKLASADVRDICVWDTSSWSPLISKNRWCFHAQKISNLAWSPDGEVLASAGLDDSIYLWSLNKKMKRVSYHFCHRAR